MMTAPPDTQSRRSAVTVLCTLMAMSGCHAGPDVQVAGKPAPGVSIAEGRRLLEAGRAVLAVSAFRRLLRQEGANLQALNGLAIAYSELGRTDLATEMFSRALAMEPNDAATLNNIGFSALRRADVTLARHYLTKARGRNGKLGEIEGNLARLALLEGIDLKPKAVSLPSSRVEAEDVPPLERAPRSRGKASRTPDDPAVTMIDFTTVRDPFTSTPPSP